MSNWKLKIMSKDLTKSLEQDTLVMILDTEHNKSYEVIKQDKSIGLFKNSRRISIPMTNIQNPPDGEDWDIVECKELELKGYFRTVGVNRVKCPKCGNTEPVKINKEASHFYCQKCNSAFKLGDKDLVEGSLSFNGVPMAGKIFNLLTKDRSDMTPELRSALETQMTAIIFDQWFEGFKAGQLANITYTRGYYDNGKTRGKPEATNRESGERTEVSRGQTSNGKDCINRRKDNNPARSDRSIKERVAGIDFIYPSHIKVPENIYVRVAEIIDLGLQPNKIEYDGRALTFSV